jgi:nucleotide-binding universal stress UspA family protein
MKFEHILLTTDLSPESLRPCKQINELAVAMGARITLLHVVHEFVAVPYGAPLAPPLTSPDLSGAIEHARLALEDQKSALNTTAAVETDVITGDNVHKAICKYAEQHGVDLIALSTHGRTGFRHMALGSVAEAVLRHAAVPVMSFPQPAK